MKRQNLANKREIDVTYYHRQPMTINFSIERLFRDVREALPSTVRPHVITYRFPNQLFMKKGHNIIPESFN